MPKYTGVTEELISYLKGMLEANRRTLAKLTAIYQVFPSGSIAKYMKELAAFNIRLEDSTTGKIKYDPREDENAEKP